MPFSAIGLYMQQLPRRQSELMIMMADASMVPHLSAEDRRAWLTRVAGEQRQRAQVVPATVLAMRTGIQVVRR